MDQVEAEIWKAAAQNAVASMEEFSREIFALRAYAAALRKGDAGEMEATWRELCAESQRVIDRGGA